MSGVKFSSGGSCVGWFLQGQLVGKAEGPVPTSRMRRSAEEERDQCGKHTMGRNKSPHSDAHGIDNPTFHSTATRVYFETFASMHVNPQRL